MPTVNSDILIWARETAGLTEEEAAKKLGLSGPDRLKALELGKRDPSRRQLVNMSAKYRRPLLTFYLPYRPRESDRGQDFRTLPDDYPETDDALLDALMRDVQARQSVIRVLVEEEEEAAPLAFVGAAQISDGVQSLVASIQSTLAFDLASFRRAPGPPGSGTAR